MSLLALCAIFLLFADGDLTLMWTERIGHKAGECIFILRHMNFTHIIVFY